MKKSIKQSTLTYVLNGLSIALVLVLLTLFLRVSSLNTQLNNANVARYDLTSNANRFMDGSAYLTNEVRAYAATGDISRYDNYWNEINNLKNRDIGVANLREIGISEAEEAKIEEMYGISNGLVPLESAAMDKVKEGDLVGAIEDVYGQEYSEGITKIGAIKTEFLEMIDTRSGEKVATLLSDTKQILGVSIALVILLVAFQVFSLLINRIKIIRPIKIIKDEMLQFSKGNISSKFDMQPDTSEIGQLVNAIISSKKELSEYINEIDNVMTEMAGGNFNASINKQFIGDFEHIQVSIENFADNISATINEVGDASGKVTNSSLQISDGAQILASGASEQAATIEELAASLTQVASQINDNSRNSQKASEVSQKASEDVLACNKQMESLMEAMTEIDKQANQINNIIKTIDDIAFQTNILALNAAVEAARAGEVGRGFAVVADEVRDLASKSAKAAQDTAQLIEKTVVAVKQGNEYASTTAEELQSIVGEVQQTSSLVGLVTEDSKQQAVTIDAINQNLNQISAVVMNNSSTSEQSAASAEGLTHLADILRDLVAQFNTRSKENNIPDASHMISRGSSANEVMF